MSPTKAVTVLTLVALLGGGLFAWSRSASSAPAPPASEAGPVAAGVLSTSTTIIAAPGRVEPISEEIDVAAEVSGRLREMLVDEGDHVEAGRVVARLENEDYAARVASARASVAVAAAELQRLVNGARVEERREARAAADQASAVLLNSERELQRRRGLSADGVISREELDRASRDVDVARARLEELRERAATVDGAARTDERARAEASLAHARARLAEADAQFAKTIVRAPITGIVVRRHRQAGESASVESPQAGLLLTLADTRVLRVRAEVDERDVAGLRLGQHAFATADAYRDRRFSGRVVRIGQILGRKAITTDAPGERVDTKVLEVLVELEAGAALPLGLRVDTFIETGPAGR